MYTPEYHPGSTISCNPAEFQASICIRRVDSDADKVAGMKHFRIKAFYSFINNDGIAVGSWRGGRNNVQPTGRDNSDAEGYVAGVYEMNANCISPGVMLRRIQAQNGRDVAHTSFQPV